MVTYIGDTDRTVRYEQEEGSGSVKFSRIKKKSEEGNVRKRYFEVLKVIRGGKVK